MGRCRTSPDSPSPVCTRTEMNCSAGPAAKSMPSGFQYSPVRRGQQSCERPGADHQQAAAGRWVGGQARGPPSPCGDWAASDPRSHGSEWSTIARATGSSRGRPPAATATSLMASIRTRMSAAAGPRRWFCAERLNVATTGLWSLQSSTSLTALYSCGGKGRYFDDNKHPRRHATLCVSTTVFYRTARIRLRGKFALTVGSSRPSSAGSDRYTIRSVQDGIRSLMFPPLYHCCEDRRPFISTDERRVMAPTRRVSSLLFSSSAVKSATSHEPA